MPGSTRARRQAAVFFVLTWLLGGLWALATPVMGVPDEPAHVIRAASLVRGELVASSRVDGDGRHDTARVPETLAYPRRPCFADGGSPSCAARPRGRGDVLVEVESRAARYNPAYYAVVGVPTLVRPGEATVYAMRLVTAALVASLLTLAVVALGELEAPRWGMAALAVATTPMTLFLAGSVNPSAVEVAAGLALWATLLVWFSSPDPARDRSRAIRAGLAAVALVTTRALAPLFLAVIVLGALLVSRGARETVRSRPVRITAAGVGAATLLSLGWTLAVHSVAAGETVAYPELRSVRRYVFDMLLSINDFERQMIGVFGWLDTPAQEHVYIAWFAVLGLLVLAALAIGGLRHRILLLGLVALAALVPVVIQWPAAPELGLIWQGRYHLPVMVGLPLAAGIVLASDRAWNELFGGAWSFWSVVGLVGAAHVAAYWWALHRNVIGLSEEWIGFTPLWQPPLGWIPLTLAYAAAMAAWTAHLSVLARPSVGPVSRSGSERAS